MHLAVVSTSTVSARRNIKHALKVKIWAMPCAVCGLPHGTTVDHIVPVACGGSNDESNLQPLCRWCNGLKKHNKTNRELERLIAARGLNHFKHALWIWGTRHRNCYDGPGEADYFYTNPDALALAHQLHRNLMQKVQE
jgi:hypothetical protein